LASEDKGLPNLSSRRGCSIRDQKKVNANEKASVDWEKGLQICGVGGKSRRGPAMVVGKYPNRKSGLI
jgi:hypothetical protein